ncbi:MAG: hypothetical protein AB7H88_06835 [Vicinamibacterales bacterium]
MTRTGQALAALMVVVAATATPLAETRQAMFEGRPAFGAGLERGYYVWRDGDRWHVRWTTTGRPQTFSGTVVAAGGDIADLDRVDLEREARVVRTGSRPVLERGPRGRLHVEPRPTVAVVPAGGDRVEHDDNVIRFHARTDADIDGFDFTPAPGVRELRFVLEVDGQSRAVDVEVGRDNRRPDGNPFTVALR